MSIYLFILISVLVLSGFGNQKKCVSWSGSSPILLWINWCKIKMDYQIQYSKTGISKSRSFLFRFNFFNNWTLVSRPVSQLALSLKWIIMIHLKPFVWLRGCFHFFFTQYNKYNPLYKAKYILNWQDLQFPNIAVQVTYQMKAYYILKGISTQLSSSLCVWVWVIEEILPQILRVSHRFPE